MKGSLVGFAVNLGAAYWSFNFYCVNISNSQVIIIRGENHNGDIATCCYCLLTHKDEEIYTYMLVDIWLKARK